MADVVFDINDTQPNNVVSKPSDIRDDIATVSLMTVNDVGDGAHLKHQQHNLRTKPISLLMQ